MVVARLAQMFLNVTRYLRLVGGVGKLVARGRVETELEGTIFSGVEFACPPHFAESAFAEAFFEYPRLGMWDILSRNQTQSSSGKQLVMCTCRLATR